MCVPRIQCSTAAQTESPKGLREGNMSIYCQKISLLIQYFHQKKRRFPWKIICDEDDNDMMMKIMKVMRMTKTFPRIVGLPHLVKSSRPGGFLTQKPKPVVSMCSTSACFACWYTRLACLASLYFSNTRRRGILASRAISRKRNKKPALLSLLA